MYFCLQHRLISHELNKYIRMYFPYLLTYSFEDNSKAKFCGKNVPLLVCFRSHVIYSTLCKPHNHTRSQQLQCSLLYFGHFGQECLQYIIKGKISQMGNTARTSFYKCFITKLFFPSVKDYIKTHLKFKNTKKH